MPLISMTTTDLRLRRKPDGDILSTVPKGREVQVLGFEGDWAKVVSGTVSGSMFRDYLRPVRGSFPVQVSAKGLNLRAAASGSAKVVTVLTQGERLEVTGWQGEWLAVSSPRGSGFVSAAYVRPAEATVVAAASTPTRLPDPAAVRARREEIAAVQNDAERAAAYEAIQLLAPYYSQRDNQALEGGVRIETESGRMCNLTSLAMVLAVLGIDNPRPGQQFEDVLEALRQENRMHSRTELRGWASVAQLFEVETVLLTGEGVYKRSWWESTVRPELRFGRGVMMSISNHIVRLLAVRSDGLIVDDPYGKSVLKAGQARSFEAKNAWMAGSPTPGQATLYPWADVEIHTMRWVASLARAVGPLSFGVDDMPDLRDDGPSDPDEG